MFAEGAAWLQGPGDSFKESMAAGQKGLCSCWWRQGVAFP